MHYERKDEEYDPIYQMAMDIIDQEWIDAGITREELEQNRQIVAIIDRLRASGRSLNAIEAEWEGKSKEQILLEYALVPVLH